MATPEVAEPRRHKVDGYEAASLYRNNANFQTTGSLQISNAAPEIKMIDTTTNEYSGRNGSRRSGIDTSTMDSMALNALGKCGYGLGVPHKKAPRDGGARLRPVHEINASTAV